MIVICLQKGISLTGYINHTLGQATRPSSRSQHKMNPMVSLKACCLILVCLGFFFLGGGFTVLLYITVSAFAAVCVFLFKFWSFALVICFLKRKEKKKNL